MIARRKFRTDSARKRERIKFSFRIVGVILATCMVTALLVYVVQLDQLRIQQVYVQTDGVIDGAMIASAIESDFSSNYFGLFPKNSIFRFSHTSLKNIVQEHFPRAKEVAVKRSGPWDIGMEIEEREPDALWCGDVVPPIAEQVTSESSRDNATLWGACYFMDEDSYIYAKAPLYSGNVFPRYYGSLEKAEPLGQYFISQDVFTRWQTLYRKLRYDDVVPHALLFLDDRDIELYLSNGLKVLIPINEDTDLVERRLISIFESNAIDYNRQVEYVDLRFGQKAFVKYLGGNEELE